MKLSRTFAAGRCATVAVALVFLAFFTIEYLTPFHSDDYSYGQMGFDWAKHWRHYMGWSGRLVADYASSLILLCRSHAVVSLIMALFAAGTCWLITDLPSRLFGSKFSPFKFLLITALYWICNPNLGQTTFWVVGACNYLVTNFCIVLFLYAFFTFRTSSSWGVRGMLFVLALLAGCTNENTSLAIVYTFIAACVLLRLFHVEFNVKSACLYGAGLVIGMLVLLLAPGNFARANHPAFRGFKTMSVKDKIVMQLHRGRYLRVFWQAYALEILGAAMLYWRRHADGNAQKLVWSLLFLSSSCAAFVVMAGSPAMPARAYSGVFFFLLIAVSFALDVDFFKQWSGWLLGILGVAVMAVAVWSWTLVCISYGITKDQEAIRNGQVNYEKLVKGPSAKVVIPDWYFVRLRKSSDMFDMYHSGAMAGWFGVSKIDVVGGMDYDYSVARTGKTLPAVNTAALEDLTVRLREASWKTNKNGTITIETSTDIRGKRLAVAFYADRSRKRQEVALSPKVLCIQGKYVAGVTVRRLPALANVEVLVK